MRTLIGLLLIAASVAGCSGGAPAADTTGLDTLDVDTDTTLGAISGVVVSETIVPIAGATVTLAGLGDEATTNENGQFAFEKLEPGVYFVDAQATSFLGAQASVEVVAGEVAKPRVMLAKDQAPQPYTITEQFAGHMVLSDFFVVYAVSDVIGDNDLCKCEFTFTSDPGVKTAVLETYWDSSVDRVEEHDMYWDFWDSEGGHDSSWVLTGDAWHISMGSFKADETDWRALISSGEQPDVEQPFEGFVTFWYVDEAPNGWAYSES